jgi:hypothetical protein
VTCSFLREAIGRALVHVWCSCERAEGGYVLGLSFLAAAVTMARSSGLAAEVTRWQGHIERE